MGYYYEEYPRRRRIFSIILLSIISAIIGGIISLSLAPLVYGPEFGKNLGLNYVDQENGEAPLPQTGVDYSPVVAIAERVGPTVVGISNQGARRSFFNQDLVEQGSGSGVIISRDGYIVTNFHVIDQAERILVNLADGRQVQAEVRGSDPDTDLAVLKINATNLNVATLGDSEKVKVGELVVAIGNPLGYEFARSVTAGVVSAKDRNITIQEREFKLIQTDAAINPGNSGGALVNSRGEVIGINSAKLVIQGVEGMGFAIPISDAKPIINELIERGYISRPSIGIWGSDIDERLAKEYDLPQGIYIKDVIAGGPAQKAGIQAEDILLSINNSRVKTFEDLKELLKKFQPDDVVTVTIFRDGSQHDFILNLGERGRD